MPNIKFRFKNGADTESTEPHTIFIRYRYGRLVDFQSSTGIKIEPVYWDDAKQQVKNKLRVTDRNQKNRFLSDIRNHLIKCETEILTNGGKPTKQDIKRSYQQYFKPQLEPTKPSLLKFIESFIDSDDNKHKAKGTKKTYQNTLYALKRFDKEVYKIDFDDIDLNFRNDLIDFLEGLNYTPNTIAKNIQILKLFMAEAHDKELHNNNAYLHRKFKKTKPYQSHHVYLTDDELTKIFELDLSNNPKLDQARDLFLIGAYTGLRVSDFNNLTPENIISHQGNDLLRVNTQKTDKEVYIPLRDEVKAIFKKHGNQPPKRMPDQHINLKIKDVCENAGIDDILHIDQIKGGKKISLKKFKYDLVKTHTARRSFCTNAYLSGINTLDIMNISGHTSEKTFLNYIKADALQKANKISKHPFFAGKANNLKAV